jgi:hypothetical protein
MLLFKEVKTVLEVYLNPYKSNPKTAPLKMYFLLIFYLI